MFCGYQPLKRWRSGPPDRISSDAGPSRGPAVEKNAAPLARRCLTETGTVEGFPPSALGMKFVFAQRLRRRSIALHWRY